MQTWLLGTSLLLSTAAFAQNATPLQVELEKLAAEAQSLQHDLPSFTCKETALSQSIEMRRVKKQVRFAADLRVVRDPGGRLSEHVIATEINGKRVGKRAFKPPVLIEGGFDEALIYFLPDQQSCFHFTLNRRRLDFDTPPTTLERPACRLLGGPQGFALLDEGGNVTHIERQVSPQLANLTHLAIYTAIDLVPIELNGHPYPLSSRVVNDVADGNKLLHFEAAYTGCRQFAATVTLRSAEEAAR